MARVLVTIPTRNRPDLVRHAVRSVLAQTMQDFRLVVTENPSTPEVSRQVRAWVEAQGDPRLSYHLHPVDGGEYLQGRFLVADCREPYCCMLHDDDRMEPRYLETALRRLDADDELAFFSSSQTVIDVNGDPQPELTQQYADFLGRDRFPDARMDDTLAPLLEHGLFSISGAVFRHASVAQHGLVDPDLGGIYPFEFNVFLRVAERGLPAWYTPERLVAYRWHSASMRQCDGSILTRYMVETLVELLRRRRFHGRAEALRRRLLAYNLRNLGCIQLVAGERTQAVRTLLQALRLHPQGRSLWAYAAAALVAPWWLKRRFGPRVNLSPPSPSWAQAVPRPGGPSPTAGHRT
ncbi:MAG: glycosyltransferase family 2 protein, partial [Comamonadaceae bacterium]